MKSKLFFMTIVTCFFSTVAFAQDVPSDEYREEFKKFVSLSGSDVAYSMIIDQVVEMSATGLSAENISDIKENIKPKVAELMVDSLVPIYEEVGITLDDIKELNKFYSSTTGKKLANSQGDILKRSSVMGQKIVSGIQALVQAEIK